MDEGKRLEGQEEGRWGTWKQERGGTENGQTARGMGRELEGWVSERLNGMSIVDWSIYSGFSYPEDEKNPDMLGVMVWRKTVDHKPSRRRQGSNLGLEKSLDQQSESQVMRQCGPFEYYSL